MIVFGAIVLLTGVAGAALWQWREAVAQKALAQSSEGRAVSARKNAEDILEYLLYQLTDKLQPIGHLDIIEDVQKQVETYYKNLGFSQQDPNSLHNWGALLRQEGDRLMAQGDLKSAKAKYEEFRKGSRNAWSSCTLARAVGSAICWFSHGKLGDALKAQGDLNEAKAQYHSSIEIMQKLRYAWNKTPGTAIGSVVCWSVIIC